MNEQDALIGSLCPWFGGKRTMASTIVEELGPHHAYWELFCGSMAVLLAKAPSRVECVNDLHADLTNLAFVIKDPQLGSTLYRRLRRTIVCEGLFRDSLAIVRAPWEPTPEPNADRAYHYFVASWQGINGVSGTQLCHTNFARRFSSKGGDGATRFRSAVNSIPGWRRRLVRVQVLRSDAFDLAEKIEDAEGVVIYADPPYLKKGAKYLHDFAESDHVRLAAILGRFKKTRVVVSYYADDRLKDLYPGWHVRECSVAKSMVQSGMRDKKGRTEAPEVLLVNDREARLF